MGNNRTTHCKHISRIRQKTPSLPTRVARLLLDSGVQAIFLHRIAHGLHKNGHTILAACVRRCNLTLTGADIHPAAILGAQVQFIHSVGIVIGAGVVVGNKCEIYGGVVLGGRGGRRTDGFPQIGSNSVIGIGAKVLGQITIGHHVTIAAGAIVLTSAPDYSLMAGAPACIKKIYRAQNSDKDTENPLDERIETGTERD